MTKKAIFRRALELKFKGKRATIYTRKRRFARVLKDIRRAKSWKETERKIFGGKEAFHPRTGKVRTRAVYKNYSVNLTTPYS